jgi:hypothetical protein
MRALGKEHRANIRNWLIREGMLRVYSSVVKTA